MLNDKLEWHKVLESTAEFVTNYGALGNRVTKREELDDVMNQLFGHDGPATLEVFADVTLI
jgi:thiamine pyrophosphate-dependent acetolactate synthase large subunit-like protein